MLTRASAYIDAIEHSELILRVGKVRQFNGLVVESEGPDVFIGELCMIYPPRRSSPVEAEVVGFRDGNVLLMPYGNLHGIYYGSEIVATGKSVSVSVGEALKGRIIDAFGRPLDDGPPITGTEHYPLYPPSINPLARQRVKEYVETGVKVMDAFLPMAKGQRMGIFAGSGVGKSSVLGMIARNMKSDVNVIALIGERGREVLEFVEESLGEQGLARSVVVVASSDQPALVRCHAAYAATSIAEYFCDQGLDVSLAMDSVTRFAMAQREVGLAVGEPPTARGYTPSVFAALPRLAERAGNFRGKGSITAFYTVLVEGDDFNEPISDHLRAILDGHMILTREQANKGIFPAVDLLQSTSRLISEVFSKEEISQVRKALAYLSEYTSSKDLIDLGAYKRGSNVLLDEAMAFVPQLIELIKQDISETSSYQEVVQSLNTLLNKTKTGVSKAL